MGLFGFCGGGSGQGLILDERVSGDFFFDFFDETDTKHFVDAGDALFDVA